MKILNYGKYGNVLVCIDHMTGVTIQPTTPTLPNQLLSVETKHHWTTNLEITKIKKQYNMTMTMTYSDHRSKLNMICFDEILRSRLVVSDYKLGHEQELYLHDHFEE